MPAGYTRPARLPRSHSKSKDRRVETGEHSGAAALDDLGGLLGTGIAGYAPSPTCSDDGGSEGASGEVKQLHEPFWDDGYPTWHDPLFADWPRTERQQWELVRAFLDVNEEIGRADAATLLGVGEGRASGILSELYNERGVIIPVRAARGRGVRYRLTS